MHDTAALRRLLIVDPCDDCHRLLPGLETAGWEVRSCSLELALENRCDLGLLRLQESHLRHPDAVKDLIKRSNTEWIAVLNAEQLRMQNVGDFVCEWFFDFHTLPFDVSRVLVTWDVRSAWHACGARGRCRSMAWSTNCWVTAGRYSSCENCWANWRLPNRRY